MQDYQFSTSQLGEVFLRNTDEIFHDLPNVSDIAGHLLVVGYDRDSTDHDETLEKIT